MAIKMSRNVSTSLTPLTKAISMSSRRKLASSASSLSSWPLGMLPLKAT